MHYSTANISASTALVRGVSRLDFNTPVEALAQHQPAAPIAYHCCSAVDTPTLGPGSDPHHASAHCRHCGHFIKWLSQYTPAEHQAQRQQARQQAMAQRPPSPLQIAYLTALGDAGPPPANMAEASGRIDAALQRGEVAS